jgi:hypothetical protein
VEGPTAVMGLLIEPPSVAFALLVQEPSRIATNTLLHLQNTTDDASTTTTGCTYHRFLSLRRADIVFTPSSTGSFPLGRTLHIGFDRGRVVCLS